jgi:hypothetical protein
VKGVDPVNDTYLGGEINLTVKAVKEPLLCRKCTDSDDAFKQFTEAREDRRP